MDTKVNGGVNDTRFVFRDGALHDVEAISVSNGKTYITDTGTVATVGSIFRPDNGAYAYMEFTVIEVPDANTFVLPGDLSSLNVGDDFFILKRVTQRTDNTGAQLVVASSGPTQFVLDGTAVEVEEDTGTPANSVPFPVKVLDANGLPIDYSTATLQTANNVLIGAVNEAAPGTDTANSGLNGRLQRIAQRLTSLITLLPTSIGQKAKAASLAVTLASDDDSLTLLGAVNEAAPGTDTASSGLNGRLQRIAQRLTSLIALVPASLGQKASADSFAVVLSTEQEAEIGATNEAAPGTDTATAGLNGRLQRIAQRLTSLIALLPASLGQKASASSLAVVLSTEQEGLIGSLTEAAPGTDTASSGLSGRLQRIAQRLTSLIALVPASLGQKTMANSFAVTVASDQTAIPTTPGVKAAVTVKQAAITVGTTAVRLTTDAAAPSATRQNLMFMCDPASTANFYMGSSGVTTSNGVQIFVGQNMIFKDDCNDYYIISDAAAQSVRVVEAE